jgi:hypothetical protein
MISSTHAIYNLALLGRKEHPERVWPIIIGAFIPDLPAIFCFIYFMAVQHQSIERIVNGLYPLSFWHVAADWTHSIPIALGGCLVCGLLRQKAGFWIFLSMVFHSLEDLPVHAVNAHRHFLPFTGYLFQSRFSYADLKFHAPFVAPLCTLLAFLAAYFIWRRGLSGKGQIALAAGLLLEVIHTLSVWMGRS